MSCRIAFKQPRIPIHDETEPAVKPFGLLIENLYLDGVRFYLDNPIHDGLHQTCPYANPAIGFVHQQCFKFQVSSSITDQDGKTDKHFAFPSRNNPIGMIQIPANVFLFEINLPLVASKESSNPYGGYLLS